MPDKPPHNARWSRPSASVKPGMPPAELARLALLGIHPAQLAGRLRLVLTIGCYHDFRFTRDILLTSSARDQLEPAITALQELGAHCDCEVLQVLGEAPLGVLWHNA